MIHYQESRPKSFFEPAKMEEKVKRKRGRPRKVPKEDKAMELSLGEVSGSGSLTKAFAYELAEPLRKTSHLTATSSSLLTTS